MSALSPLPALPRCDWPEQRKFVLDELDQHRKQDELIAAQVATLVTDVALIKRDMKWAKWLAASGPAVALGAAELIKKLLA